MSKPIIRPQQRRKTPSFSSSLLEAIYHSIDESKEEEKEKHVPNKRSSDEEEIVSLRRAILIEKWMESYKYTQSADSTSSTDSSMFSSLETESASRLVHTLPKVPAKVVAETAPKCEGGRFMRTKSRALKIYGDLKKVKQPISPGGKIANFLNSIFNMKKNHHDGMEDWSSVRKSRSVSDSSSLPTRSSCLNKTPSSRGNKSKRSVRFCPVSVIVDEDCQPCGHKSIYKNEEPRMPKSVQYRGFYQDEEEEDDGRSCASSDLFELDNIGMVRDGLPVYGTTSFKMNQAIARGLVM